MALSNVIFCSEYALAPMGIARMIERGRGNGWISLMPANRANETWSMPIDSQNLHHTFAEAQARADELRVAEIASLRKRIAELEALDFSADSAS